MNVDEATAQAVRLHHAGRHAAAAALYQKILAVQPDHLAALNGLGMIAFQAGRCDAAVALLERVVATAGEHAGYLMNLGAVQDAARNEAAAAECYARAIAAAPGYPDPYYNLGALHLRRGEAERAVAVFERCRAAVGREFQALAYQAHALLDAGRVQEAAVLLDHERLVRRHAFAAPTGFPSLESFNDALAEHVSHHPSLRADVMSTVNGRHTGELLSPPAGPMAALEKIIREAVATYRRLLPDDPEHPMVRWAPSRWKLTGWGVVMHEGGHERTHVHPNGWLSGVLYVALPAVIADDEAGHQGWLRFGEPSPEINSRCRPELRDYRPRYGDILLFPSYFYHGTVPFHSPEPRVCISFDVEPLAD
jgi:tetratricopeptide (TPR) repeat protein